MQFLSQRFMETEPQKKTQSWTEKKYDNGMRKKKVLKNCKEWEIKIR